MRVALEPAFVLHSQAFRESSMLLSLFTQNHGRISLIAKGVRSPKSKTRGLMLPFQPLLISWSGKTELMTLTKIETQELNYNLKGLKLISGFYLNELLLKLTHQHDPYPNLYIVYQNSLRNLQKTINIEQQLRLFEKELLREIGFGIEFTKDIYNNPINAESYYQYEHEHGFRQVTNNDHYITGKSLLAFANNALDDLITLREIKRLMRQIIRHLFQGNIPKCYEIFKN